MDLNSKPGFGIVREPCDRLVSEFAWGKNQAWFDTYYKDFGVVKAWPPTCVARLLQHSFGFRV